MLLYKKNRKKQKNDAYDDEKTKNINQLLRERDPPPLPFHSATVIDWRWRDHVINPTVAATPLGPAK